MSAAYWISNLLAWSAQAAMLIAAGLAVAWLFRLRLPRARLGYWQVLLAITLLLPAIEPWRHSPAGRVDITTGPSRVAAVTDIPRVSLPWRETLLLILAAGCAFRGGALAVGFVRLARWRRGAQPYAAPEHVTRLRAAIAPRTELALASGISGPVTFGFARPLILLPESFADLSPEAQEAIACHELLHVRRHDWLVTAAEEVVRAAAWFHPGVWWLAGQIQLAREQTVDAEVVRLTRDRRQYLNALLAIAGDRPGLDLAPATLFLRKRHLKKRVALLLEEITMTKRTWISFCAASSGVLLAAGWLALHTFPLQAAPGPQDSAELLHSVAPVYPPAAKEKHIEGAVVMEVQIDAEGHVTDARVLSGPQELRNAALTAVLQWHYSPKALNLPASKQVTINFTLAANPGRGATIQIEKTPAEPFTLKHIEIVGLNSQAREELMSRLPVHVGDTLDSNGFVAVTTAVRSFDDHLSVTADPEHATLAILLDKSKAAPGPGDQPRIRVGGSVQQAKLQDKVNPVYPAEAKAQHIEGRVRLEATISAGGMVENLRLIGLDATAGGSPVSSDSDGAMSLARAAIDAVRQWKYETTLLNGNPVAVITEVDVNFTLSR